MPVKLINPSLESLESSPQKLTSGEWEVLKYFSHHLGKKWEVYVQPHLNGLRADFVLLHPSVGIVVVEVKDWDLAAMNYRYIADSGGIPQLWATRSGERIFLGKSDPVSKIDVYKDAIFAVFCPRLKDQGFGAITGVIAFPFAKRDEIEPILEPARAHRGHLKFARSNTLLTLDDIALGEKSVRYVIPSAYLSHDLRFSPDGAEDLRHWLVEPEFSREQRVPLIQELDTKQQSLVNSRTESRFRKIRGPAGSGKSLVLAGRAALLATQGKRVLLVTFNITLINYLLDYAVRLDRTKKVKNKIEAWSFHFWCKLLSLRAGCFDEYRQLWVDNKHDCVLKSHLAKAAKKWCAELDTADRYDAILVDEGQDFQFEWWLALRGALASDGEMLLAVDRAQNIYGLENWVDDDLRDSGLSSRWVELSVSYRMPESLIDLASRFLQDYLPGDETVCPTPLDRGLPLVPERLKWIQCNRENAADACFDALVELLQSREPLISAADLTFITDDTHVGYSIIQMLQQQLNLRCIDTLEPKSDQPSAKPRRSSARRKKLAFFKGDGRAKVTTVHSFKGWESSALVVYISKAKTRDDFALAYAGITRLKATDRGSQLTVVSCASELATFGRRWPTFKHYGSAKRRDRTDGYLVKRQ